MSAALEPGGHGARATMLRPEAAPPVLDPAAGATPPPAPEPAPRRTRGSLPGRTGGLVLLLVLVVLALLAGLAIGSRGIAPGVVWDALLGRVGGAEAVVVRELRLPRTLIGVLVGLALGAAGALMQALTRNPLADPGLLGVNSGASAAIVVAIAAFGLTALWQYVWFAFAGAAIVSVIVYLIGTRGPSGATPARLALAGMALAAALQAGIYAVLLLDPQTFDAFRLWRVGSLAGRDAVVLVQVLPFVVAGLLLALALARPLNVVALGEDTGKALGVRVGRTRALTGVAVVLLCGSATAAAGPIAFAGLAVPHVARAIVGPDQRWVIPYSALLAVLLVVGADVLGRVVSRPGELEVGVVVAFLGAPAFLAIARRRRIAQL